MSGGDIIIIHEENKSSVHSVETIDTKVTVPLQYPIKVSFRKPGEQPREETIDKITLRRPNGGDLRAVQNFKDVDAAAHMFARLSGLHENVFDNLDAVDIDAVSKAIEGFFPKSRKTGKS